MHKRFRKRGMLLSALIPFVLLAACTGQAPEPTPTATATPAPTSAPTASPTSTPRELAELELDAGIRLHDVRDYPGAVKSFSAALSHDPSFAEAYFRRAISYYLDYNLEASLADIDQGFSLGFEPETASQFVIRGRAYSLQDRNEEALADFEQAIETDPGYPEAYVRRANLLAFNFNDVEGALTDLNTAIALDPTYALAYQKRGSVHRIRADFELAVADLETAIELDPAEPFYLSVIGEIYLAQSEYETATEYLTAAIEMDPRIAEAYFYRSLASANLGDLAAAAVDMKAYVERVPEDPGGYYFLGLMNFDQQIFDEAVAMFEAALELGLDPQREATANQYIVDAYEQLNAADRYTAALVSLEEANGVSGDIWTVLRDDTWDSGGCRYFTRAEGISEPALPEFFTCVIEAGPDAALEDFAGLYPDAAMITSGFDYPAETAIYGYLDGPVHFEIQLLRDGFLHVVNVSTEEVLEPDAMQAAFTDSVDEFLNAMMGMALERTSQLVTSGTPTGGSLSMSWLVSAEDLNAVEAATGISNWEMVQESPGASQICRFFRGVSWSASPNESLNCISETESGSSFDELVAGMFENGLLLEGEEALDIELPLDQEHALFTGILDTGHSVFDLLVLGDGRMYWVSVSLGTPLGSTPPDVFEANREAIETFLIELVRLNIERAGQAPELTGP